MALTLPFTMKDNYESKGITIIQDGEPMTEEEEKVYKCSDCDLWVTSTESCCEEEEEEYYNQIEEDELDKCGYTGGMIEGYDGCGDLLDPQDTSMLGNTSYCIECYEKHEDDYYYNNPIEPDSFYEEIDPKLKNDIVQQSIEYWINYNYNNKNKPNQDAWLDNEENENNKNYLDCLTPKKG